MNRCGDKKIELLFSRDPAMEISLIEILYQAFWRALDWIYPPDCASCGIPGQNLCKECQSKIRFVSSGMKNTCDSTILLYSKSGGHEKRKIQTFNAVKMLALYEGVIRECIHELKYNNNRGLGELFSAWLADLVRKEGWDIDIVIPVALNPDRVRQRGYNQSAVIARPLAVRLHKPYTQYALERIRNTPTQVGLNAEERRHNVAGAFSAETDMVVGKNVLLVDDVLTTGATLEACTIALLQAGVSGVYCVTVAGFSTDIPDPFRSP